MNFYLILLDACWLHTDPKSEFYYFNRFYYQFTVLHFAKFNYKSLTRFYRISLSHERISNGCSAVSVRRGICSSCTSTGWIWVGWRVASAVKPVTVKGEIRDLVFTSFTSSAFVFKSYSTKWSKRLCVLTLKKLNIFNVFLQTIRRWKFLK